MSNRFRCWADLPSDLLDSIISRLGSFHDLLAFQATCRSWHATFLSCPFKYTLAALFPPLLLEPADSSRSPHPHSVRNFLVPTRPCRVIDIANQDTTYQGFGIPIVWTSHGKNALPSSLEKFCFSGASYGHLIFSSNKSCVVFDVFTGVTASSPQLPFSVGTEFIYGALTAPLASANSCLIIEDGSTNLFWRVGSHSWVAHSLYHGPIKQVVVFKGQVFGMDSDRRLFKVHLASQIRIQELPVLESSMISRQHLSDAWQVVCGDMLLLVGFHRYVVTPARTFEVFRLDVSTEPALWLKVEKLENWAIFISKDKRSQALSCMNPEIWGGRSNCIYCYNHESTHWIALEVGKPLEGDHSKLSENVFIFMGRDNKVQPMWIVPSMYSLRR